MQTTNATTKQRLKQLNILSFFNIIPSPLLSFELGFQETRKD